ncbi:hypothetical protein [Proteiniborus ethanoligenes]|nr:hypothetical protein [Proteiniborus ethanoligenes]
MRSTLKPIPSWGNDLIKNYRECILSKKLEGFVEESDYEVLNQQTLVMEVLVYIAYEIQKARLGKDK